MDAHDLVDPERRNVSGYLVLVGRLRDEPDETALFVQVPDLPGCMTHGGDMDEALEMAADAIATWLDACRTLGRPFPEPSA
jgi:predicted RNase H-like HicB family nuclease